MRTTRTLKTMAAVTLLASLALVAASSTVSCGRAGSGSAEGGGGGEEGSRVITVGRIKSGFAGVGGEHTGWMLLRGGKDPDLEADVSAVLGRARELDGTKVRVSGTLYAHDYVERGKVQILKIETLQPVTE